MGSYVWFEAWDLMCGSKHYERMGFWDLLSFNVAMLGKHDWRLIVDQYSLVSQIFKGRYYVSGDFVSAHLGYNSSFI